MTLLKPVECIKLKSWKKLESHFSKLQKGGIDLRAWLDSNTRVPNLSYMLGDYLVDLSKNLITEETVEIFNSLAEEIQLKDRLHSVYTGEHINNTEDRPVLHTALRRDPNDNLIVDSQNISNDVSEVLAKITDFSNSVRSGEFRGSTGKKFKTIVNIGIGGSDLGPAMVYEAMKGDERKEFDAKFVSNVDPNDIGEVLKSLDVETTLFVIVSKTFTTLETVANATVAKNWLVDKLGQDAVKNHFIAVSTALDLVADFGIDPNNSFGFWNWVGGRYSVDSAVGTILSIVFGPEFFNEFLQGFRKIDDSLFKADNLNNNPLVILALLNIFYCDFYNASSHAVLPYNQYLSRFPAYLQQLTMESNGKAVKYDGSPVDTSTGEIFWGEPGTNGQHAFYQLIHQGTHLIPVDFIAYSKSNNDLSDGKNSLHQLLLSNVFAQSAALAFGKTFEEVKADEPNTPDYIAEQKVFTGNRPSTTFIAPELNASSLGQLIAIYEHITLIQGFVWGINSFDQWGVQLGKVLANNILPSISGEVDTDLDPSTIGLINFYKRTK